MPHWTREKADNDRLRWRQSNGHFRGKRLAAGCPITHAEARIYVKRGAVALVAHLRDAYGLSIREALDRLNEARYGKY